MIKHFLEEVKCNFSINSAFFVRLLNDFCIMAEPYMAVTETSLNERSLITSSMEQALGKDKDNPVREVSVF